MHKDIPDILEQWQKYKIGSRNNRDSSVTNYLKYLREFFNYSGKHPGKVTIDDIEDYIIYLKVKRINKINTQKIKQTTLRLFYAWYSHRFHSSNPTESLMPIREEIKMPMMPTPDELTRMVYACDNTTFAGRRNAAIICLFADTGIRLSECVELNIDSIQVHKNNYICMVPRIKGRRERMVPFGDLTAGALVGETFSAYYTDAKYIKQYKTGDPLFKQDGIIHKDNRLGHKGLRGVLDKYQKEAELDKRVTPLSFRHYFGTYRTINGTPLQHLKQLMGHAWAETTQRYIHWAEVIKADSLKKHGSTSGLKSKDSATGFSKITKDAVSHS
jgi:integrase/recombinase XerC